MKKEEKKFLKIGTVIEAATTSHVIVKSTITDIKTEKYEKDHKTQVLYEFDNTGKYIKAEEITGDTLFILKATCYKKCRQMFYNSKIAELQNDTLKPYAEFEKKISRIKRVEPFTNEEAEELKVLILTVTQNEQKDMNRFASLVYRSVMNGMSSRQVLQCLRNRVKQDLPVEYDYE